MKAAIGQTKPLVTTPGPRSLIFRGAVTGVSSKSEGLQFYEVVPVALVVGTQMATGHRTMDTHLFFEGELIDASTGKPVIKVVRKGEGEKMTRNSGNTVATLKQVVDNSMATDATMFDVNNTKNNLKPAASHRRFFYAIRRRLNQVSGRVNITGSPSVHRQ